MSFLHRAWSAPLASSREYVFEQREIRLTDTHVQPAESPTWTDGRTLVSPVAPHTPSQTSLYLTHTHTHVLWVCPLFPVCLWALA